jgi:hypothetical protein
VRLGVKMLCVRAGLAWGALAGAAPPLGGQSRPPYGPAADARARSELLRLPDVAWRTWFAGDAAGFRRVVPDELLSIDPADTTWRDREGQLEASRAFAARGGALHSLAFPRNVIQIYGDVAILYSTYEVVYAVGRAVRARTGRATEVFVRRRGRWIHTGWHIDQGG